MATPATHSEARSRRSRGGRLALAVLAVLLVACGALVAWVAQPAFLRWAVERAVKASDGRLAVEGLRGSLLTAVEADALAWREDPAGEGLQVRLGAVRLAWRPAALLRGAVDIGELRARDALIRLAPASGEPPVMPASLALPLQLRLRELQVQRLRVEPPGADAVELEAVTLAAGYAAGRWRIERLQLDSPWGGAALAGTIADAAPFAVALEASLALRSDAGALPLKASAGGDLAALSIDVDAQADPGGAAKLTARLRPFDAQPLVSAELVADALDLAALGLSGLPRTRISGRARLLPEQGTGTTAYRGDLAFENAIPGTLESGALPLARLASAIRWQADQGLRASDLRLSLAGAGRIEGSLQLDPARALALPGARIPWLALDLRASGVDPARISSALPAGALAGRASSNGERFDLDLADAARGGVALRARGRIDAQRLQLERADLATGKAGGGASLEASGSIGVTAPHALSIDARFARIDPSRVPALLALLQSPGQSAAQPGAAQPAGVLQRLAGAVDGRLQLQGSLPAQAGVGRAAEGLQFGFELSAGTLGGLPARGRLDTRIEGLALAGVSLERLRLRSVDLDASLGSARLQADGALGAAGDRLAVRLRTPSLDALARLAGVQGLAGAASADGVFSGSLPMPGVELALRANRIRVGDAARADAVNLDLRVPQAAGPRDAALSLSLDARDLVVRGARLGSLRAEGAGTLGAHTLRLSAEAPRAGGQALLAGGWRDPAGWSGELRELELRGAMPAKLAAPVSLMVDPGSEGLVAGLGSAVLQGGFGAIRVTRAGLERGRWTLVADATLSRLGTVARQFGLTGEVPGAADALDALGLRLRADLTGTGGADASGSVSARLDGPPDGAGQGRAELELREGVLSGPLELALPTLALANRMIGPAWGVDGRIRFAGRVSGTLSAPRLVGDIEGSGLALQQHAMGWRLRDGSLAGRFDGERFRLDSMKLYSGPPPNAGSVELRGEVRVADFEGRFDLVAERFAVLIGPGQRVVVSGNGEAVSRAGAFEIRGRLRADEGRIELAGGDAPSLPDDVVIVTRGTRPAAAAEPEAPVAPGRASLRIASDVTLDLGENLRVHGSGIDARLAGSVNLRGTLPEAPRAFGTVRIRDGRYRAYGQELQITRGLILFNGPLDNPQLDIVALRREQAVEAGVAVTGTVLSPQVRLTSRPEVPDAEKLSWLVLGVPLDDARSGGQGAALQAAAARLFGSNDGSLAGGLASALGLDMLTIRSGSTGTQGLLPSSFGGGGYGSSLPPIPGQVGITGGGMAAAGVQGNVLAVGKRLSSRLLLTYERGLHGVWNLLRIQYDITRRLSLRAQTGSESAIDVLYRFSFD